MTNHDGAATSMRGSVQKLLHRRDLAIGDRSLPDRPVLWARDVEGEAIESFVADIGHAIVSTCFTPIQVSTGTLFLDQTYEHVRIFYDFRPRIDDATATFELPDSERSVIAGRCVLIGGSPEDNWYHWVLNWFPRLVLVHHLEPDLIADPDTKFIFYHNVRDEPYRSFVDLFGIPPERLVFVGYDVDVEVERLVVPTLPSTEYCLPSLHGLMRDTVHALLAKREATPPRGPSRIYISREDITVPKRRIVNKDATYRMLAEEGVLPVKLEGMRGIDQVSLFRTTELMIGVHGAGLVNVIFCPPSVTVIIMDNERNRVMGMAGMFTCLCSTLGLRQHLLIVEEERVAGTDYDQFYNLHNCDVIAPVEDLRRLVRLCGAEAGDPAPGEPAHAVSEDP